MKTTAGSLALGEWRAPQDAFVASRLRQSGALILGKTNLSEWANFRSLHSISGWSGRGGQTRNPYALDRNPSGSSSGSGVAVAASLKAGAEVIDPADLPTHGQLDPPEMEVLLYEFKDGLNRYLSKLPAGSPARSLKELIAYNERNREREMPLFEQELFIQAEAKGALR